MFVLYICVSQFSHSVASDLDFSTPDLTTWTSVRQTSLSISKSQRLLRLMSIELVMPSNHLILCCPLLLLPSTFPNIRVFSNESIFRIRWPNYWIFTFSISPSNDALPVLGELRNKAKQHKKEFPGYQLTLSEH